MAVSEELQSMFREAFGQTLVSGNVDGLKGARKAHKDVKSENYKSFLRKYKDLEKYIDKFKPMDLVYYFREKSRETENYYVIHSMHRDLGIFKRLLEEYTSVEICAMAEFLFCSGQKYLKTAGLQPTVLCSGWGNQIYADTLKWCEGKFDPDEMKHKKNPALKRNKEREWQNKDDHTAIGEWGDEEDD